MAASMASKLIVMAVYVALFLLIAAQVATSSFPETITGRKVLEAHTNGRSGYNKVNLDGRSGYNKVNLDGRSGYNKVNLNGRGGYNKVNPNGRGGYNKVNPNGRGR